MRKIRLIRLTVALAALAGCEHTAPFRPDDGGAVGPLNPGSIAQLTFSLGQDVIPAWLPDGSGLVFTAERRDRADHDRCLAFLPGDGGAISRYVCSTSAADDTINVFDEAALLGDSMAYVRAGTERFLPGLGPDRQALVVAPIADPNATRVVQQIPFTTPWGATYDAISHVAWLGPGRLAFIGEHVTFPRPCSSCAPDTVRVGIGLVIADVAGAAPVYTRMPDGDSASSLAVDPGGIIIIYFTRNGDTRVFRRVGPSLPTDTVLDFGAAGVVRDIAVRGGTLVAVVGGIVGTPTSPDEGGALFLVAGAAMARIGDPDLLYRRPALSPDGARLVVSARDSVSSTNLWLFQLP
jgi:hypothetical protein